MKISETGRNNIPFKGLWNNKLLLNGLEKVSEHATSFTAGVSVVMPLTVRPLAILATPDVEKENKHYACASSVCSGLMKFGLVAAVALPIENAVKYINKNYGKMLTSETTKKLKPVESKAYKLATQIITLSSGLLTAIPKSMLTIALIPIAMDKIFGRKKHEKEDEFEKTIKQEVAFKGNPINSLAKGISKILNNEKFGDFVVKHANEEKNIAKHMSAATDVLLSGSYAYQTMNSNGIKENRKKALVYNNVISTAITILGGYLVDNAIKNKTSSFIKQFSEINKKDPKLHKYIQGLNVVRPAVIFAGIYYGIIPMFSTYMAEKIDKMTERK